MRELSSRGVDGITKTDVVSETANRFGISGEKSPTGNGRRSPVIPDVPFLFVPREFRSLPGVNTESDDVEVLACSERHYFQSSAKAVELNAAEHRTLVVDRSQENGPGVEEVAKTSVLTILVMKYNVGIDPAAKMLVDTDARKRCVRRLQHEDE